MVKKEKDKSRKVICRPHNETWLLQFSCLLAKEMVADWMHGVVGRNPKNTTSAGFILTPVQVGTPRYLPWGREFQLDDVMLWISTGVFGTF